MRLKSAITAAAVAVAAVLPAAGVVATSDSLDLAITSQSARQSQSLNGLDPNRVFPDPLIAGDYMQYTPGNSPTPYSYLEGLAELDNRHSRAEGGAFSYTDICVLMCEFLDEQDLQRLEDADFDSDADVLVRDMAGSPTSIRSYGGRELPVITLTAPEDAEGALPLADRDELYFSMSIHGLERAGLEGGLRYIEDLAIAYDAELSGGDPHVLTAGDPTNPDYAEYSVAEVLNRAQLHFINPNPDGWSDGDRNGGALFNRGNANGIDLNRQYPTLGWHNTGGQQYNTASQPETIAVQRLIEDFMGRPEGAADLHGEFGDNVLLAIMFPAGQFDPLQLQGQFRLAEAIKYNVNNSVHPGAVGLFAQAGLGEVQPAEYHTAYDAIGYDDSGFQGDYLVQQGILEMDHEYIFSNLAPNSVFIPELEQVHVDTTRALLDATISVTLKAYETESAPQGLDRTLPGLDYSVDLGPDTDETVTLAYVRDPETIDSADVQTEAAFGLPQVSYSSNSGEYFEDMRQTLSGDSQIVRIDDLLTHDLTGIDRIAIADDTIAPDDAASWAILDAFVQAGGDLVLTDAALQGLEAMGIVAEGSVERTTQYAGEISEVDESDPLLDGVGGIIRQTYFEVPLGYPTGNSAPAWTVSADAWTGTVAATVGATTASQDLIVHTTYGNATDDVTLFAGDPAVGTVTHGAGTVTIFGAILPDASNVGPNTHGLADYAVTYAGNGILLNALRGSVAR